MRLALALPMLAAALHSPAQDFTWWNETHGWDGVSHWSSHLVFSPAHMGPNALPVPPLERGAIDSLPRAELGLRAHFSAGDRTQDATTSLHLPMAGGRVALALDWMALEHYRMDTVTRDLRRARDRDGRGFSTGDVNLGTLVQLLPERPDRTGLLLRVRLRTASGNNMEGARHTDAPGYSFDLSAGRWRTVDRSWLRRMRPHATLGLLVYQTNRTDYFQNDCLLFGAGLVADHGRLWSEVAVAGWLGYLDMDDRPVELRASLGLRGGGRTDLRADLRHGLRDQPFTTVSCVLVRTLSRPRR